MVIRYMYKHTQVTGTDLMIDVTQTRAAEILCTDGIRYMYTHRCYTGDKYIVN